MKLTLTTEYNLTTFDFPCVLLLIIRPYMKMPEIAGSIFQKSISITEQCYILINQYNSKFGNG